MLRRKPTRAARYPAVSRRLRQPERGCVQADALSDARGSTSRPSRPIRWTPASAQGNRERDNRLTRALLSLYRTLGVGASTGSKRLSEHACARREHGRATARRAEQGAGTDVGDGGEAAQGTDEGVMGVGVCVVARVRGWSSSLSEGSATRPPARPAQIGR